MDERSVLDPRQLERIEGVHRGFLYQHLYGVGCLFLAGRAGVETVIVERDEDIEVVLPDQHVYVQVRTRAQPLVPSDVSDVLARFEILWAEHANGNRSGTANFWIVSNVPPGPALRAQMDESGWPVRVMLRWPGHEGQPVSALPPAWPDVASAVGWCESVAASVPFAALLPNTLVWKLAGLAQLKSSGVDGAQHSFRTEDLPRLFEQIGLELQQFPSIPARYRPQVTEPALLSNQRVRFIVGFSGAGKTVWASQAALHVPAPSCYFDVGDIPGDGVVASLARELAGRFFGSNSGALGQILLPGASPIDMLRRLDQRLIKEGQDAVVVVDNAHRASTDVLRRIVEAASNLRIVVLSQPDSDLYRLLAALGIEEEHLSGWAPDTVAAEIAAGRCRADYATCQRLIDMTAGLPLYIQSAVSIASAQYDGNIGEFCDAVATETHVRTTAQEVILKRLFDSLPDEAKDVLAILSVPDCPLTKDEAVKVIERATGMMEASSLRVVREHLVPLGIVQLFGSQRLKAHDAIRLLGQSRLRELGDGYSQCVYSELKNAIEASLLKERDISRFGLFVRLLGLTGDVETLVDIAGEEMFHELGLSPDFKAVLERAAQRLDLSAALRFWALDAIVFAELNDGEETVEKHLEEMSRLVEENALPRRDCLALAMKRMLFAAKRGQESEVYAILGELETSVPDESAYLRVLKYNAACSLYFIKKYPVARDLCGQLVQAYYDELGLNPLAILGTNPAEILPLLPKTDTVTDNLKHLADSLDLYARCCQAIGVRSGLARAHAFKFYGMIGAISSALKVGQDFVDEFLQYGDPIGARQVFEEHLLPLVYNAKMVDRVIPLRSHYAVVLAYCGDFVAAEVEMSGLASYESGLLEAGQIELGTQRELIDKIKRGTVTLPPREDQRSRAKKIGRNERCPCGSGKKYKRCHGRSR